MEKEAAQEREQFRDLEERLLRTEQFADATLASEAKAQQQTAKLEEALAVRTLHLHVLCRCSCACLMHGWGIGGKIQSLQRLRSPMMMLQNVCLRWQP